MTGKKFGINELFARLETIEKELDKASDDLRKKDALIKAMQQEIDDLYAINYQKDQKIKRLEYQKEESAASISLARLEADELTDEIITLQEQLAVSGDSLGVITEIQEIIKMFVPNVSNEVDQVNDEPIVTEVLLPEQCKKFGKPFSYAKAFVKKFQKIGNKEQLLIVKQLNFISEFGPEYASLRTNKNFYDTNKLKKEEYKSRGGKFFRFTWDIKDQSVHISGLFSKKDLL